MFTSLSQTLKTGNALPVSVCRLMRNTPWVVDGEEVIFPTT
jgi:hypothetical protein